MTDRPLTLRQRRAVQALAGGTSYEAAAREAGVSARALYSWRREEWFQAALRETQDALLAEAPGGLRAATAAVVTTLRAVMDDADAPVTARVRAALGVLDHVYRVQTVAELEDRIVRMEANLAGRGGPSQPWAT